MDKDYSNREIDRMFGEIRDYLTRNEATNNKILEQTTKTNGRVNEIEKWKEGLMGKVWGISTTVGVIWAVLLALFFKK